jgi:hypothetical protein
MKKAIVLSVNVQVEGEDEPAHDFARLTKKALRDILAAGIPSHPDLTFSIRKIKEADEDSDDDNDKEDSENSEEAESGQQSGT